MTRIELCKDWQAKLSEFDPETGNFAEFCRMNELKYHTALRWKQKLHPEKNDVKLDFTEMTFSPSESNDFILKRNGWEILVPAIFNDQTLRRILAAFER